MEMSEIKERYLVKREQSENFKSSKRKISKVVENKNRVRRCQKDASARTHARARQKAKRKRHTVHTYYYYMCIVQCIIYK